MYSPNRRPARPGPGGITLPWSTWSPRRKFRLARTAVIALVLIILVRLVACGDDSTPAKTSSGSSTTALRSTTTTVAQALTASVITGELPEARYAAPAAAVNGQVLIFGGLNRQRQSTRSIWAFDPATNQTTSIGTLPAALHDSAAAPLGTTALLFGGQGPKATYDNVWAIDPAAKSVTEVGKMPAPRTGATAIVDSAGATIYVVGGSNANGPTNEILSTMDGTAFTTVATLAEPTVGPAVALVGDTMWVFGGEWNSTVTGSIQRVNLKTGQVQTVAQLSEPVSHATAFTIGRSVFLVGGRTASGRSGAIRRFDPKTFTFPDSRTLPTAVSDAPAALVGDSAYLLGGSGSLPSKQIQKLSPG